MKMPTAEQLERAVNESAPVGSKLYRQAVQIHQLFIEAQLLPVSGHCIPQAVFERGVHTGLRLAEIIYNEDES